MKKTWFHGLALSLGITTIPSVASAQYTTMGNKGLSASSFQLPPLPAPPQRIPQAYGRFAGYYQEGAVGSGAADHVHVPVPNQGVQPSQYQADPYSIGASPGYEASQGASTASSNCPGCAAGNCATHGVGVGRAGGAYGGNGGHGVGNGYGGGAAYGSAGGPSGSMGYGGAGSGNGFSSGGGVVGSGGPAYGGQGYGGGAVNGGMGPGPMGPGSMGPGPGGPGAGPGMGMGGSAGMGMSGPGGMGVGPVANGTVYEGNAGFGGATGGGVIYDGGGYAGPGFGGPVPMGGGPIPMANGPVMGGGPMISGPGPSFGGGFIDDGSCGGFGPEIGFAPEIVAPSPWIFGASGLLFNRVDDYPVRLTSDSNMPTYALLNTRDAAMQASGGFQGSVGRYFGCGRYAIVGTYWGIFSDPRSITIMPPAGGNLRSDLPFTLRRPNDTAVPGMPYGIGMPGQHVYDWYDGAFAHRLVRDQDIHNVELNFFSFALGGGARQAYATGRSYSGYGGGYGYGGAYGYGGGGFGGGYGRSRIGGYGAGGYAGSGYGAGGYGGGGYGAGGYGGCGDSCGDVCGSSCDPCATACAPCGSGSGPTGPFAPWYGAQCSKLRLNLYGGVRYFRFRDDLEYATSETDAFFGSGADDFYYRNNVTNDLVGFQLGSQGTWCLGSRFNLFGGTAFGLYNNHIQTDTSAGTATQAATIISNNAFNGRPYSYMNTLNDVAFLGEGTIGTGIRITPGWTMNLGYRVVGVSGLATAVGQIPRDFSNGDDVNRIHNDRSLILHGALFGANYNF